MRATRIFAFLILTFTLASCDLSFGYKPPAIPLSVSIDTQGQVTFSVEQDVKLPTPIGTFSVGVVVDPAEYFGVKNTLTVRYNGEDRFYNLHGEDFEITFEGGCYEDITFVKTDTNLFLELDRISSCLATIEFDNQSSKDICCVYISPCGTEDWGGCWLADNEIIPAGRNRLFSVDPACYDVLLVNCDDTTACEHYGLEIYEGFT